MFYVGQKVVCVDATSSGKYLPAGFIAADGDMNGLTSGHVYTIREAAIELGVNVCRVDEIIRPFDLWFEAEAWFASARFRPIVERKTDISVFTEMLTPSPLEVSAALVHDMLADMIQGLT